MKIKNILLLIFAPVFLLLFHPDLSFSALTEEGIYRIEEYRYFVGKTEVSAEDFLTSLFRNMQCDGTGAKKRVNIQVSFPAYSENGDGIPGRTLNSVWKVTMPASMTIQRAPSDQSQPAKIYGNSTTCNPY